MKRRLHDKNSGLMVGVNTWLFGVGALMVGYNAYFGISISAAERKPLLGQLSTADAMMISSFAIMLAGFFYSLIILKPDMLKKQRERKLMALKVKASQHLDFSDKTTGLHNKDYLIQVTRGYLQEFNALDQTLGILVVKISAPRDVHVEALRAVASTLQGTARDYDVVSRIGFDTIAVLVPHIKKQDLVSISNRYHSVLAHSHVMPFMVDCSIGFAANEKNINTAEKVLEIAENNLLINRRLSPLKNVA